MLNGQLNLFLETATHCKGHYVSVTEQGRAFDDPSRKRTNPSTNCTRTRCQNGATSSGSFVLDNCNWTLRNDGWLRSCTSGYGLVLPAEACHWQPLRGQGEEGVNHLGTSAPTTVWRNAGQGGRPRLLPTTYIRICWNPTWQEKEKAMAESEGGKDGERQKWSHLCCAD